VRPLLGIPISGNSPLIEIESLVSQDPVCVLESILNEAMIHPVRIIVCFENAFLVFTPVQTKQERTVRLRKARKKLRCVDLLEIS
jgi:hypothetical protein